MGGGSSVAFGVSTAPFDEQNFPIIVGESELSSQDDCPEGGTRSRGFAVEYDLDESITLISLASSRTGQLTGARDVQNVVEGDIIGFSTDCPDPGEPVCNWHEEALSWNPASSYSVNDMDSIPTGAPLNDDYQAEALCINKDGQVSGWCGDPDTSCRKNIYFWPSLGGTPTDLHTPFFGTSQETQGLGIRDQESSGRVQIVGEETILAEARLWERVSGTWAALKLVDLIDDNPQDCGAEEFEVASDINQYGQIIVLGMVDDVIRSYILSPRENCPADLTTDLNGCVDGHVNVYDLFILLDSWNTDGPGAEIAFPFDNADVFDLFVMLDTWGYCGGEPQPMLETEEDCFDKFGIEEIEALISCLEAVHELD